MRLKTNGENTSEIEVSHIDSHGFWLCVKDEEYFLSYEEFPWFEDARVKDILNVKLLHAHHLHWPQLDVDIEIDSLKNPQKYPLKYK